MNKQILPMAIAVVALMAVAAILFLRPTKTVYVETNVLLEQYEGMKTTRKQIEIKHKELGAGVDSIINLFQTDLKEYEKTRKSMSAKERELKEELLRTRQQQINGYQQAMQKKATEEEQKLTLTQINRINDFIKTYGKDKGYEYILGANGSGNVVYAKEALNITQEVLDGLNKAYRVENGLEK